MIVDLGYGDISMKLPNDVVKMVTSESELRHIYMYLAFIPVMSALVGFGLARGGDGWIEWGTRVLAIAMYCCMFVLVAKSRFTLWQIKGDLFR